MRLIVCLDDNNGMTFNRRRQSSDMAVTGKILELVGADKLWMNSYSGYLFADKPGNIQICEDFLDRAEAGEYCFVENLKVEPYFERFSEILVFRWNRIYPSDMVFPDVLHNGTILLEFAGNSHEKVTLEAYKP